LVTWKEMWSRTNQLGQVLYGLGMKKGDRLVLAHGF
jgi:acyl-CoA synthetase (AMP-forming)/AMP-acid ligase II